MTQWRLGPTGRLVGLDYSGARAVVAGLGLNWRKMMEQLAVMESEVLKFQSEKIK